MRQIFVSHKGWSSNSMSPVRKRDVVTGALASGVCEVAPQAPYDLSLAARFFAQRSPVGDSEAAGGCFEELSL